MKERNGLILRLVTFADGEPLAHQGVEITAETCARICDGMKNAGYDLDDNFDAHKIAEIVISAFDED